MDAIPAWIVCPIHGNKLKIHCKTCREFVCPKCLEHKEHDCEKMKTFFNERKDYIPSDEVINHKIPQISKLMPSFNNKGERLLSELPELKEEQKRLQKMCENSSENLKNELQRVQNMEQMIDTVKINAYSKVLQDTCKKAYELFNIQDKIEKEFNEATKNLQSLTDKINDIERHINKITMTYKQMEKLEQAQEGQYNEEDKLALLMLEEKGILDFNSCINCPIEKYNSFRGISEVFNIYGVMRERVIDVGHGIKMTEPLTSNLKFGNGNYMSASISHLGVISVCYFKGQESKRVHFLQLLNVFTKKERTIKIESWTRVAFYDTFMIVMTNKQKLRKSSTDNISSYGASGFTELVGGIQLWSCPPNTLLNQTRILYYRSLNHDLYQYNVDTSENLKIVTKYDIDTIASSGGIDMGVKCLFRNKTDCNIYSLNNDNSVKFVANGNGRSDWYFSNVFPSSSDKNDLSKALYLINGDFYYKNEHVNLNTMMTFNDDYSTIRLFKDIFLAHDKKTKHWVFIRIIVP